jgi:glutathione synthase/RimK-type ligase-like ATP-grasp enzyme
VRPVVALLSYATVKPGNLHLLRSAAGELDVTLLEVPPHEVRVRLSDRAQVLWQDRPLHADVVLHRTVQRHLPMVLPVLDLLASQGVPVLNDPAAAVRSRNKLHTLLALHAAGLPVPPTEALILPAPPAWRPAAEVVVSKPALGVGGEQVRAHEAGTLPEHDPALGPLLVQPAVGLGTDYRAYVVDGGCVAAARRTAAPGEFRANASLGATVQHIEDPELAREVARLSVAAVEALGLDHAAVDLLRGPGTGELLLSEVDAWGGFEHLQRALDVPVARAVLALAVRRSRG